MRGQEVRSADNTVVVPLDLRLPQESESEKYAAYMLGLSFPFPLCSQECASSESCFSCHSLRIDEDGGKISARFSPSWRHWRACMQTRTASAQERILGGLSSPVIRDVVGVRSWYPLQDGDEIDPEQQSQSLVLRWALHHMLRPRSCIYVDVPRIHELAAAFLGLFVGFHYTQLSPLKHLSFTQLTWLRRFEQHHAARRLSSSQRGALCLHFQAGRAWRPRRGRRLSGHRRPRCARWLGRARCSRASGAGPARCGAGFAAGCSLSRSRVGSSAAKPAGNEHSCPRSCGSAAQLESCGCRAGSWRSKALPGVSFWRRGVSHASSVFGRCCFHVLFWLAVSWFRGTAPLWPQVTQRWARMTRTRRSLRRCRKRWTPSWWT